MFVLAGGVGIEQAAKKAGYKNVTVPFRAGRMDATQEQTDVKSFSYLEPTADAFRNYFDTNANRRAPTAMMVDKADLLGLSVPEMTVLFGGLRTININTGNSSHGVFTAKPGTLSQDYFVNLLSMDTKWVKADETKGLYKGLDRKTGKVKYTATPVDLVFGSHTELRAIAEVYAAKDAKRKFLNDFISAWTKVMRNDRFDLK